MAKLWAKGWDLDKTVEAFETKDDLTFDNKLAKWDVIGSMAQAEMLHKINILNENELTDLRKGLDEILGLVQTGKFELTTGDEDIHSKVENYLTDKFGEAGKKLHTGRSRNDQVLLDIRLFTKDNLLTIWKDALTLAEQFNDFAKKYEFVAMPGYTHMQKAMPSSVGMWAGSFAESLIDDMKALEMAFAQNDQSPLGSAAGYGAPLNLDRKLTADLLGFDSVQVNSLYCQNSRGKIDGLIVASLNSVLMTINRFATDILLFTTAEYDYFTVGNEVCSGSSIMPQKKNLDLAELLRSKIHVSLGYYQQLTGIATSIPSGYNRDIQDTKKPLIEALELTDDCIKVTALLLASVTPKPEKMKAALTNEIFATHEALAQVAAGTSFREAYRNAGKLDYDFTRKIDDVLRQATHIGGTGNLGLELIHRKITESKKRRVAAEAKFNKAIKDLTK